MFMTKSKRDLSFAIFKHMFSLDENDTPGQETVYVALLLTSCSSFKGKL